MVPVVGSYMGFTLHFFEEGKVHIKCLDFFTVNTSHTSDVLLTHFKRVLEEYNLTENIVARNQYYIPCPHTELWFCFNCLKI